MQKDPEVSALIYYRTAHHVTSWLPTNSFDQRATRELPTARWQACSRDRVLTRYRSRQYPHHLWKLIDPGIGAAIAQNLASKGASIVLNYTSDKSGELTEKLASDLQSQYGTSTVVVQADMGDPKGPAHLINSAKNHFSHPRSGKFQIDILVNNAAIAGNASLEDITAEDFHKQYTINVLGPILVVQAALPYLPNDRSGRIVNLSSVSASQGLKSQTVYGGTKAAVDAMTRTWSRELAERATVNSVNPGPVATDMYGSTNENFQKHIKSWIEHAPLMQERKGVDPDQYVDDAPRMGGRPGYPQEIAGVVAMLCLQDSAWTTGSVISCNGGMVMST